MTRIFGRYINQIFNKVHQKNPQISRQQSLFRKSKTKENVSPYIILRATKDDHLNILQLMHESYFSEEPTSYSLGITRNTVLDERAISAMAEGMTVVARCKYDGRIVGSCINSSTNCWDPDLQEKLACSVRCQKVRQLLLFYAHLQRFPDIWKKYNVNKVFEMDMLFVHKNHRKKGIAGRLLRESRETAADCGFKIVRCDATNAYTDKNADLDELLNVGYKFVSFMYGLDGSRDITEERYRLYNIGIAKRTLEKSFHLDVLPPTKVALKQHILRTYLQIQQWIGNFLAPDKGIIGTKINITQGLKM